MFYDHFSARSLLAKLGRWMSSVPGAPFWVAHSARGGGGGSVANDTPHNLICLSRVVLEPG